MTRQEIKTALWGAAVAALTIGGFWFTINMLGVLGYF
jgi:hypothetical protein